MIDKAALWNPASLTAYHQAEDMVKKKTKTFMTRVKKKAIKPENVSFDC